MIVQVIANKLIGEIFIHFRMLTQWNVVHKSYINLGIESSIQSPICSAKCQFMHVTIYTNRNYILITRSKIWYLKGKINEVYIVEKRLKEGMKND